jgi:hypothetical protein
VSQIRMEVKNYPCSIPSLINDDASFGVFERHTKGIGLKLLGRWGIKEEVLVLMAKASFNHWRLKEDPDMQDWGMVKENAQKKQK